MRSRMAVRVMLVSTLGVLGMGMFATQALARDFPNKPTGGKPAGIPEKGKYQMTVAGDRLSVPPGGVVTRGSVAPAGTSGASSPNGAAPRTTSGRTGLPDILGLIGGASPVVPTDTDAKRYLAVHVGTETYYVGFQSDGERKQFLANLEVALADMGMEVKRPGKATQPAPSVPSPPSD